MSKYAVGDKVQVVDSLREVRSMFAILTVPIIDKLFGKTVTIADVPADDCEFYYILEDDQRFIYSGDYFKGKAKPKSVQGKERHKWMEREIRATQILICKMMLEAADEPAGTGYRFVDLVTPYREGKTAAHSQSNRALDGGICDSRKKSCGYMSAKPAQTNLLPEKMLMKVSYNRYRRVHCE